MAIQDIMMPRMDSGCMTFTVDTSGPLYVTPVQTVPTTVELISSTSPVRFWRAGDSFMIINYGYLVPEPFCFYERQLFTENAVATLEFKAITTPGLLSKLLTQVGQNGVVRIPNPNIEYPANVFIDSRTVISSTERFVLNVRPVVSPLISMVGIPVALNGLTFHIIPFATIQHNFALASH